MRRVETIGDAERERFLGPPSVRVDGYDIEPGADARTDYGLKCRLYRTESGDEERAADRLGARRARSRRLLRQAVRVIRLEHGGGGHVARRPGAQSS